MKTLTTLAAATLALMGTLAPASLSAQSSAADYTSASRYDALGRVTGTIAPDPDISTTSNPVFLATRTTYDVRGNVIKVETGALTSWQSESVAPANWTNFTIHTIAETTYDAMSRKLTDKVSGKDGSTITPVSLIQYSYDSVGRLECTAVRMNPLEWSSLPADACTLDTEGAHGPDRITKTVYDAAGQVLQIRKAVGTPIEIAEVTYSYTDNGNIEYVIDANGNRAELRYDGHDRQSRWVFPETTRYAFDDTDPTTALASAGFVNENDYEEYTYDAVGNRVIHRKRDGREINFTYDKLNRITKKDLCASGASCSGIPTAHTRDVYYAYDLRGLQTKARFDSLSGVGITYAYDGFGRLTSETQNTDGVSRTVSSQYDANGNRTRITHPDSQYFELAYDGLNRANAIKQATTTLGEAEYDDRGLPSQLEWTHGAVSVNSKVFGYDEANRLTSIALDLNSTSKDVAWTYTRNPASQIISETQNNDTYSWDKFSAKDWAFVANGLNQYSTIDSQAHCYDDNGNLTYDGTNVYLYDVENRLVEMRAKVNADCEALSYAGTLKAQLNYDPTGRLYQLSGGSLGIQRFAFDGNAMIAEYNGSGVMLRRYVHGSNVDADDPLIWYEGSAVSNATRRYLHTDPRGSIVAVTDYQGTSTATNTYDEYGIPDNASGNDIATKGRFRYTGQAWIPEIGMYYYKARIYVPTLGRFLQTDPISYSGGMNLYAYARNDPIGKIDPSGLAAVCVASGTSATKTPACVRVDGDGDGETSDKDLSSELKKEIRQAFGKFIQNNHGANLSKSGAKVIGKSAGAQRLRVVTQFVGAALGGLRNSEFHVDNSLGSDDAGTTERIRRFDTSGEIISERFVHAINLSMGDHMVNLSSLARTVLHEFGHRDDEGGMVALHNERHRSIDERARDRLRSFGLDGMGCQSIGGFFGYFPAYPSC